MKAGAVAMLLLLVVAVAVVAPPAKLPAAPLPPGLSVNVTVLPLPTVFPPLSRTVTARGLAKVVLTVAFCGVVPGPLRACLARRAGW